MGNNIATDAHVLQAALGLSDCRIGSRAVGHCGPENDEWEDYIEVPVSKLIDVVALLESVRRGTRTVSHSPHGPALVFPAVEAAAVFDAVARVGGAK